MTTNAPFRSEHTFSGLSSPLEMNLFPVVNASDYALYLCGFLYIILLFFPRVNFCTLSTESLQAANEEKKNREDKLERKIADLLKRTNLGKSSLVFNFF